MVTYIECSGCDYKGTKTEANQGQRFISGKQLRNVWCESCLEAWKWRNNEERSKVECTKCGRKDTVVGEKIYHKEWEKILYPECRTRKKKPWWNWGVAT